MKLLKWLRKESLSLCLVTKGRNWKATIDELDASGKTPEIAIKKLIKKMSGKSIDIWDYYGHNIEYVIKIPTNLEYREDS